MVARLCRRGCDRRGIGSAAWHGSTANRQRPRALSVLSLGRPRSAAPWMKARRPHTLTHTTSTIVDTMRPVHARTRRCSRHSDPSILLYYSIIRESRESKDRWRVRRGTRIVSVIRFRWRIENTDVQEWGSQPVYVDRNSLAGTAFGAETGAAGATR